MVVIYRKINNLFLYKISIFELNKSVLPTPTEDPDRYA